MQLLQVHIRVYKLYFSFLNLNLKKNLVNIDCKYGHFAVVPKLFLKQPEYLFIEMHFKNIARVVGSKLSFHYNRLSALIRIKTKLSNITVSEHIMGKFESKLPQYFQTSKSAVNTIAAFGNSKIQLLLSSQTNSYIRYKLLEKKCKRCTVPY